MDALKQLESQFSKELKSISSLEALEELRVKFLGRKGEFTEIAKSMKGMSDEDKKTFGKELNETKESITNLLEGAKKELNKEVLAKMEESEWVDITAPGTGPKEGSLHIVSQTIHEVEDIFASIGFTRYPVREIDWDYYAFEALNMPKDHPARDEWETYFIDIPESKKGKMVATPHPSNNQVRLIEELETPFRALYIGKAYRRQADVTHVPVHHQLEVEAISKKTSFAELKGVIEYFVRAFFGEDRKVRLRPHHFRFTEPSFEVDISCAVCGGVGCRVCKQGWLELAGAGMTHPNVLRAGGLDPDEYQGFAFAFGIERILMMREGIKLDDLRDLYKNDFRFLEQF